MASQSEEELQTDVSEDEVIDTPESAERRNQRQKEWGQQYDMWLIKAARQKRPVEILLAVEYPGVTRDHNIVSCIPMRIDRYFIEVSVDGIPIWINKMWIIGTKPLGGRVSTPEAETNNKNPSE